MSSPVKRPLFWAALLIASLLIGLAVKACRTSPAQAQCEHVARSANWPAGSCDRAATNP